MSMKKFFRSRLRIGIAFAVVLAITGIFVFSQRSQTPKYETAKALITDLTQEVAVTGRVKPADSVDLTFEIPGRVSGVFFGVGDRISQGQTVVSLEDAELQAELAQARANLDVEKAVLAELERGTRPEEIEAAEKNLENVQAKASADIEEAYSAALTSAQKAAQSAKNALLVLTDIQFVHFLGSDQNSIDLRQAKAKAVLTLFAKEEGGGLNNESLSALSGGVFGQAQVLKTTDREKIDKALNEVLSALEATGDALKALPIIAELTSTQRTNLAAEKTAIDNEIVTVSAKQQAIAVQKAANASAISAAQEDLKLKKAGSTPEEIATQKARVESAEAALQTAQAKLAKTKLTSPLYGVIAKQEAKAGEFVQAGAVLVSIISEADFEIEANVPEADIARLRAGNPAEVTLDAYGRDVVFWAEVVAIDPAETIVEGVSTYTATLLFSQEDERIRSGMTANINIVAERKEGALAVPQRAVVREDGGRFVRVVRGKEIVKVAVETGLRGSEGFLEITQGLKEGDVVVTFIAE